jgi:hypothetical protein
LRVTGAFELRDKGRTDMASSGKRKTTMAKLSRESRLRERRLEKQAKKQARKQAALDRPAQPEQAPSSDDQALSEESDRESHSSESIGLRGDNRAPTTPAQSRN